jgi:SSS family solute:Na+ symporter
MTHWLNIAAVLVYLLGMLVAGVWFARRNNSTEAYFVGGRNFPGWAVGLSLIGTSISSITFIAFPADAFKTAWLRFLPTLMLIPAVLFAARAFLPVFREKNYTTAYEYLGERFSGSVRTFAACAFILMQIVRVSLVLYLVSLLLKELTGLDPLPCVFIGGIIVIAYTVAGGIEAVIWTDVVQTIVLMLGGVVCLTVIVGQLPGGFSDIFSIADEHHKFALAAMKDGVPQPTSWMPSLTEKTAAMMLLVGLIHYLTEYCGNQNVVQRYLAARSTGDARQAMYLCAGGSVVSWGLFMFVGTALFAFYTIHPSPDAAAILTGAGGHKAEEIMPLFILNHLPPGVAGLVMAAALAAAMSSLDSSINAIAAVSVTDLYRRWWSGLSERHYLRVAQGISLAAGLLMIAGSAVLLNARTETLQDTATILASLLAAGLLGIYLHGFFLKQTDTRGIWAGLGLAMAYTLWSSLGAFKMIPENWRLPFDPYYTGLLGNLIVLFAGCALAKLLPQKSSVVK